MAATSAARQNDHLPGDVELDDDAQDFADLDDGEDVQDAQYVEATRKSELELAELFRSNEWVIYETLDPIQRNITDGYVAARTVKTSIDANGFTLVRPVSRKDFLRGEDGADSVFSGLEAGGVSTGR
jgi:hypothetical protein